MGEFQAGARGPARAHGHEGASLKSPGVWGQKRSPRPAERGQSVGGSSQRISPTSWTDRALNAVTYWFAAFNVCASGFTV